MKYALVVAIEDSVHTDNQGITLRLLTSKLFC